MLGFVIGEQLVAVIVEVDGTTTSPRTADSRTDAPSESSRPGHGEMHPCPGPPMAEEMEGTRASGAPV